MRHNSGFEPEPPPLHFVEVRQNIIPEIINDFSHNMTTETVSSESILDSHEILII